jgi:predicted MFS family arabinose efflux permease
MPTSRARLGVIFLTVFIDLAGFGLVIPILPYYAERFGAGGFGFGALVGVFSAMQFLATVLLGRLSDRYGRRPVLLGSIVVAAFGYVLFAFAGSYGWLMAARALAGFAGGNISVAQAYIADVTAPADRARGMGLVGAAFGLGFVVGPAIGGVAGHYGGPRAAGLVAAAMCVANFVSAYYILGESLAAEHRASRRLIDTEHLTRGLTEPPLRPAFLVFGILPFAFSGYIVSLPLHAERAFGWRESELGWFFTTIGVVAAVVQGWAFAKIHRLTGDRPLIVWGLMGMAVAIMVIPFVRVAAWLYVWAAVLALSNSVAAPALTGLISRVAGVSEQGAMLGAAQGLSALGRLSGPLLFGAIFDLGGSAAALVASGVAMLGGWMAATKIPRDNARPGMTG